MLCEPRIDGLDVRLHIPSVVQNGDPALTHSFPYIHTRAKSLQYQCFLYFFVTLAFGSAAMYVYVRGRSYTKCCTSNVARYGIVVDARI